MVPIRSLQHKILNEKLWDGISWIYIDKTKGSKQFFNETPST